MTLSERVTALEQEVRELRQQLDARPNAHDYSGTTNSHEQLARDPDRPRGAIYRRIGFGPPDVSARDREGA